jgi:hypothetical protein
VELVKGMAFITSRGKQKTECYEFCQTVPVRPSPKGIVETRRALERKEDKVMGRVEHGYESSSHIEKESNFKL